MAVEIKSNQITGITSVSNYSDAANKNYVDTSAGIATTSDDGSRLFVFTDGSAQSWEPIGAYAEYTSPGTYTFTLPTQAKQLFIEATGAGGGGASGNTDDSSYVNDATNWQSRYTAPHAVQSLKYGGGYFVASNASSATSQVSVVGSLAVSANTVTWTLRTTGNINGLYASTYKTSADNPYVVAGYGPFDWSVQTSGAGSNNLFPNFSAGGAYDGTYFLIGGQNGILTSSSDGITWVLRTCLFGAFAVWNVSYFSGAQYPYLIGGSGTSVATLCVSTDGIIWSLRTNTLAQIESSSYRSTPTPEYLIRGVGSAAVSSDTITWILRTVGFGGDPFGSVFYNGSYYSTYGTNPYGIISSTNGIQWSSRTTGLVTARQLYSLYSDGNQLITTGDVGSLATSSDGIAWVVRTAGTTSPIYGSSYGNGLYVNTAGSLIITSTNSIIWTTRNARYGNTTGFGSLYGNNTWIVAGFSGSLHRSTSSILSTYGQGAYLAVSSDTITWNLRTTGSDTWFIPSLASNNNFYVAGRQSSIGTNAIIVSTDSINWVVRTSPLSQTINDLFYDGSTYFIAAADTYPNPTQFAVSTDTVIWILRTTSLSRTNFISRGITYGVVGSTPTYVAACYNGLNSSSAPLAISTDTITWVIRTTGLGIPNSVGYGNNIFLIGTFDSNISTSTDTITWTMRTSGFASNPFNIIYAENSYLASAVTQIRAASYPGGFSGGGGGGGATVSWNISRAYITGSSLTVNVGQGGLAGQAGAASTVSWTGNSGTYSLTANGGSGGTNTYNQSTITTPGGAGGAIPSTLTNYLTATAGTAGGNGGLFGSTYPATAGTNATTGFQATGGGGGSYTGGTAVAGGLIYYYNNTTSAAAGAGATAISGLSYGNGGGGGTAGGAGGSGVTGGGGGGGGYSFTTDVGGAGGVGGDGYVRISWQ